MVLYGSMHALHDSLEATDAAVAIMLAIEKQQKSTNPITKNFFLFIHYW